MTTLRQELQAGIARLNVDFLSFSDYAKDTETETSFRYGRDFNDETDFAKAQLVGHRYLCGSDYSGGSVIRANQKDIIDTIGEDSPLLVQATGGYNTLAFYFRLDVDDEQAPVLAEILKGLEGYCIIDESTLSEIESEEEQESWASFAAADFRHELESRAGLERDFLDLSDEDGGELFQNADNGSGLVIHEETGPYFDTGRAAERTPVAFLFYVGKPDWQALAELAFEDPDDARRILRLVRIGETLKSLETALVRRFPVKDPENGSRTEQARYPVRRKILDSKPEIGDWLQPLDVATLENKALRSFTVTIDGQQLTLDPFDITAAEKVLSQKETQN